MERRSFIKNAGLAGILAAGPRPRSRSPAGVKWRITSSFPKSLDTIYGGAEVLAKRVAAITGNKFQIQVFASGEIAPGGQALDVVQNGTVECCHTCSYYYVGKDRAFAFGTAIPFGLNARQMNAGSTTAVARSCLTTSTAATTSSRSSAATRACRWRLVPQGNPHRRRRQGIRCASPAWAARCSPRLAW